MRSCENRHNGSQDIGPHSPGNAGSFSRRIGGRKKNEYGETWVSILCLFPQESDNLHNKLAPQREYFKLPSGSGDESLRQGSFTLFNYVNLDEFVKSRFYPVFVIPAKAGIQLNQAVLGSRLRGSDGFFDFLRVHQSSICKIC